LTAERHRREAALRTARGELAARERELAALDKKLDAAKQAASHAREIVNELERELEN